MASSPITCHVLNTLSGTPAGKLQTTLTLLSPKPSSVEAASSVLSFQAETDEDGRVKEWKALTALSLQGLLEYFDQGEKTQWSLKFNIGPWYEERNIECFWPVIEVNFSVEIGTRHYHVPVLVSPYSYTTYRGS